MSETLLSGTRVAEALLEMDLQKATEANQADNEPQSVPSMPPTEQTEVPATLQSAAAAEVPLPMPDGTLNTATAGNYPDNSAQGFPNLLPMLQPAHIPSAGTEGATAQTIEADLQGDIEVNEVDGRARGVPNLPPLAQTEIPELVHWAATTEVPETMNPGLTSTISTTNSIVRDRSESVEYLETSDAKRIRTSSGSLPAIKTNNQARNGGGSASSGLSSGSG